MATEAKGGMMELLSKLVELALIACFECGVIDWLPDDAAPESFQGECEIEPCRTWVPPSPGCYIGTPGEGGFAVPERLLGFWDNNYFVRLADVFCCIDATYLETWHASRIEPMLDDTVN